MAPAKQLTACILAHNQIPDKERKPHHADPHRRSNAADRAGLLGPHHQLLREGFLRDDLLFDDLLRGFLGGLFLPDDLLDGFLDGLLRTGLLAYLLRTGLLACLIRDFSRDAV